MADALINFSLTKACGRCLLSLTRHVAGVCIWFFLIKHVADAVSIDTVCGRYLNSININIMDIVIVNNTVDHYGGT